MFISILTRLTKNYKVENAKYVYFYPNPSYKNYKVENAKYVYFYPNPSYKKL